MKRRNAFTLALILVLLVTGLALAAEGYDLSHWTAPGGGGGSSGPGYSLNGAAGQPVAGELRGSGFHLSGGFWVGSRATGYGVYLPMIVK